MKGREMWVLTYQSENKMKKKERGEEREEDGNL